MFRAGLEHGLGEVLQANRAPTGMMIVKVFLNCSTVIYNRMKAEVEAYVNLFSKDLGAA